MKRVFLILLFSHSVFAQSGGTFQIENSTLSSGGNRNSGGNFSLDSTAGQTLAGGVPQNARFSIQSGFWTTNLVPTAANVSIGGRVRTLNGQGIRNAVVTLTAPDGTTRSTKTASFGYYRFEDVTIGETYVLIVSSKRFVFTNPTQIVTIKEELTALDFLAIEQ